MAPFLARFLHALGLNALSASTLRGLGPIVPGPPRAAAAVAEAGPACYCPCCETESPKFLDFSEDYQNVICPVCDSRPRHRLFWLFANTFRLFDGKYPRILHMAPERMLKPLLQLTPDTQYVTADLRMPEMDVRVDLTQAPFPDHCFDVILCCHVLEVVDDDRAVLREIRRILKPGGWAWIQVWMEHANPATLEDPEARSPSDRLRLYGHETCSRLYGRDYGSRVDNSGLAFHEFSYARDRLGPKLAKRYRIELETQLYFAANGRSVLDALSCK